MARRIQELNAAVEKLSLQEQHLQAELALAKSHSQKLTLALEGCQKPMSQVVRLGPNATEETDNIDEESASEPVVPAAKISSKRRPVIRLHGVRVANFGPPASAAVYPNGGTEPVAALPLIDSSTPLSMPKAQTSPALVQVEGNAVPADAAVQLYVRGLQHFRQRRFSEAKATFDQFEAMHPAHSFFWNARYWSAETSYALKRYQDALVGFKEVVRGAPRGRRAADALRKMILCSQRLNDPTSAKKYLDTLKRYFPESPATQRASEDGAS